MTTAIARKLKHWDALEQVLIKHEAEPPDKPLTLKDLAAEASIPYHAFCHRNYDELRSRALKLTAPKQRKTKPRVRQKRSPKELAMIAQAIRLEAESISDKGEKIKSLTAFLGKFGLWMHVYKKSAAFDEVRPLVRSLMEMPVDARVLEVRARLSHAIEKARFSGGRATLNSIVQDAGLSDSRGLRNPALADLYLEAADVAGVLIPNRKEVEARAKQALEDAVYFESTLPKATDPEDSDIDPDSGVDLSVCRIPAARKKMTWDEYWSYRTGRAL